MPPSYAKTSDGHTGGKCDSLEAMTDPYAVDADYYDLLHDDFDDDIGLWLSFAGQTDLPVLEVGVGSGRIAVALAAAGHAVTGVDPSAAMLFRAQTRANEEGVELTLINGRPQDLALPPERFGLVLVPLDVFLCCVDGDEQVAMLRALAAAMAFNGTLALDLPGPASHLDPATNGQPLLVYSNQDEAGEHLDVWHVHEDDLGEQTRWLRIAYERTSADGSIRRQIAQHRLRYVHRFELEYLLRLAGFRVADVYGDYDLGPLTNDSARMIVIAKPAKG